MKTQTVDYGKSATPPAVTPPKGYTFIGWDSDYNNITASVTVKAIFILAEKYNLTILTEGTAGTITLNGEDTVSGDVYSGELGETVRLKTGEGFLYWKDNGGKIITELSNYRYTVTGHATLTAVFATESRVTATFVGPDNTILKTQLLRSGRSGVAPALPDFPGMVFSEWTKEYKTLTEDVVTRAVFVPDGTLSVSVSGGTASAETVGYGELVTVTATDENFAGWSLDGKTVISAERTFTMAVYCNVTFTALTQGTYCPVALNHDAETGVLTMVRRLEGDYTVLGSGLLYNEASNAMLLLESADGVLAHKISDSRLTRNGVFSAELSGVYVRGYVVLRNESSGAIEIVYTSVIKI